MLDDIVKERRKKLELLKKAGIDPYPARVKRTHAIAEVLENFEKFQDFEQSKNLISLAGRLRNLRDQGKIIFADIEDESGEIQLVLKEDAFRRTRQKTLIFGGQFWIFGDFVSATGMLFTTKRGEKSMEVHELQMAAKSLLPLPDKWAGLEDEELRLRKRYLDLIATPELRELFKKKTVFWETFRGVLKKEGFLEVETPVLESVPGGAEAEPFKTHHNALDTDFYLRISLGIAAQAASRRRI